MITIKICDCGTKYGCFRTKFGEYRVIYMFDDVNIKACNKISLNKNHIIYECFCGKNVIFKKPIDKTI